MADWKHPSHYPFEWVADQDDSEVNVDGNCILCTSPEAEPKLDDKEARRGIMEQDILDREARKAEREARERAQKEADDFSVREAARKVAEADRAAEKAAKIADKKANQEAEQRAAYASAAKAEAKETIIGEDINASHPYRDGTYNDLSVDEP